MAAARLILIYLVTTAVLQAFGYLVSIGIEAILPGASLLAFLLIFVGMFWVGWPVAIRIADAMDGRVGSTEKA